jgi:penicillin-binding protein 1A
VGFCALVIIICSKIVSNFIDNFPSIQQLGNYTPNLSSKFYDEDNNVIAELFTERRILTPIEDIPTHLSNAFISIEDNDF